MSKTELKTTTADIDGFSGFERGVEGEQSHDSVIQGALIKFTNDGTWICGDEELPADLELVVLGVSRVVQKWKDHAPIETIVLEPKQKFPDIKKVNAETPQEEWTTGPDGQPRGPWQSQHILHLVDLKTMRRYSFPTGTVGGSIAVEELVKSTNLMRKLRNANNFYAAITLGDVYMNTRYGGRQRPDLKIVGWKVFGPATNGSTPSEIKSLPLSQNEAPTQPHQPKATVRM